MSNVEHAEHEAIERAVPRQLAELRSLLEEGESPRATSTDFQDLSRLFAGVISEHDAGYVGRGSSLSKRLLVGEASGPEIRLGMDPRGAIITPHSGNFPPNSPALEMSFTQPNSKGRIRGRDISSAPQDGAWSLRVQIIDRGRDVVICVPHSGFDTKDKHTGETIPSQTIYPADKETIAWLVEQIGDTAELRRAGSASTRRIMGALGLGRYRRS